jgi:hypothetical protein
MGREGWDHSPHEGEWTHLAGEGVHAYDSVPNHKASGLIAFVIFVCLLCNLGTSLLCPLFFSESIAGTCWGRQKKQVERLFFSIGIIRFDLALHMMPFPYCIFFISKKKIWGEDAELYFFLLIAFQILHVFLPDISVHCALIKYVYIWLRVYAWYLLSFLVAS